MWIIAFLQFKISFYGLFARLILWLRTLGQIEQWKIQFRQLRMREGGRLAGSVVAGAIAILNCSITLLFFILWIRQLLDVFGQFVVLSCLFDCKELFQWRSQPKNLVGAKKNGEAKMRHFRRITLFCLEKKRLSKQKITIFSKNLGGPWPFCPPPWQRLWVVHHFVSSLHVDYNHGWLTIKGGLHFYSLPCP